MVVRTPNLLPDFSRVKAHNDIMTGVFLGDWSEAEGGVVRGKMRVVRPSDALFRSGGADFELSS